MNYHGVGDDVPDLRDLTSTMIGGWYIDVEFHPGIFSINPPGRAGELGLGSLIDRRNRIIILVILLVLRIVEITHQLWLVDGTWIMNFILVYFTSLHFFVLEKIV